MEIHFGKQSKPKRCSTGKNHGLGLAALLAVLTCCSHAGAVGYTNVPSPPRVVICTDAGGTDFDDFQSLVHLFVYADVLEIEGLISSPCGAAGRKEHISKVIDRYERDYPALKTHSTRYPKPDSLRAMCKQGAIHSAGLMGFDRPNEGSEWLVKCARRDDARPLWILIWGGIDDLAQALHDDPTIKSRLRVYFIGGPNKKWSAPAYAYIARNHPDLWMIEANDTYRGWFLGGNQSGEWGNDTFVAAHIAGRGALGDYFAKEISFDSKTRTTIKMGDTPSVAYVLGKAPEDPSKDSWGGRFVRAWDRKCYVCRKAPTANDRVETFSIVEIICPVASGGTADMKASFVCDGQEFPGFQDEAGAWHFIFSPKESKVWSYTIKSTHPAMGGQTGGFTSYWPSPQEVEPSPKYPDWWTDDPDPFWAEGKYRGAKSVSRWREDFLRDFASRMERCRNPSKE